MAPTLPTLGPTPPPRPRPQPRPRRPTVSRHRRALKVRLLRDGLIWRLAQQGIPAREIGVRMGVCPQTVYNRLAYVAGIRDALDEARRDAERTSRRPFS